MTVDAGPLAAYVLLLVGFMCTAGVALNYWVSNSGQEQTYESCAQYDVEDTPLTLLHLAGPSTGKERPINLSEEDSLFNPIGHKNYACA